MQSYYKATIANPYHLSVGAVLMNDRGEVACHHFTGVSRQRFGTDEFYLLMRETVEHGESLEQALARGLREEFGMTATIATYLGSTVVMINEPNITFQKTTLYYLCHLQEIGERDADDEEASSDIEWHQPAELIRLMKKYAIVYNNEPLDESGVVERAMRVTASRK